MGAVNGSRHKDYAFHTATEDNPWWTVDLGAAATIFEVHVYNRRGPDILLSRACPLLIEVSQDGSEWLTFFRLGAGERFGSELGALAPLVARGENAVTARFVRVTAASPRTCLHLAEVEVYGLP